MRRGTKIGIIVGVVALVVLGYILLIVFLVGGFPGAIGGANEIALIRIEGTIAGGGSAGGILSSASVAPEEVIDLLYEADRDDAVAAILLRIDSPGGTAAAGQEIYEQVRRTEKPVVASIGDMGTSAAYLIASAADRIVAAPASDVGGIGVLMVFPNYEGLYKKIGVDYIFITQGKYKDLGNPGRKITAEERKILEDQTRLIYEEFVTAVARSRKMERREVEKLANGLPYTGIEGRRLGLIDKLGNYQDGVDLAASLGKIEGEPEIVEYGVPTLLGAFQELVEGKRLGLVDLLIPDQTRRLLRY